MADGEEPTGDDNPKGDDNPQGGGDKRETGLYIDKGDNGQYNVYDRYTGQPVGQGWWAQKGAEQYYNQLMGLSNAASGGNKNTGPGPYPSVPRPSLGNFSGGAMPVVGGTAQLDPYLQQLQQEYLRLRLKMVEIPQVLAQLQQAAWQRAQGMMDYGQRQAALTGYTRGARYGVRDPWARAWQAAVSRFAMPQEEEG